MDLIIDYLILFGINLAIVVALITGSYWWRKPNRNYATAMFVGGALVYVVVRLLMQIEIGLGLGLGIFAIFSLLRFRSVAISLRDNDLSIRDDHALTRELNAHVFRGMGRTVCREPGARHDLDNSRVRPLHALSIIYEPGL